ncbi:MAG: hypothetical protein ACI9FU_000817 [Granulosicoccus sp.]|jgi:hypothetical protein
MNEKLPQELELAKRLVTLMDDAFLIPGINKRFGLDPLIGLIPILGDVVTALISLFIVASLVRHGAPFNLVLKMMVNLLFDFVIGGIPVLGDIWDFFFKSNRKNLQLLIDYQTKEQSLNQSPVD